MQDYTSFVISLKRQLGHLVADSGLTEAELSSLSGMKAERIKAVTLGTAAIRVDDVLNIARACGMRAEFHLHDSIAEYEYGREGASSWFYSDCSDENMTARRRELLRRIIATSDSSKRNQLSHELESLSRIDCNNSRLRYFIFLKVEEAMHSLCMSRQELAELMNVSEAYIISMSDGDTDFTMEFLFRMGGILSASWSLSFVPWKQGLEENEAKRA